MSIYEVIYGGSLGDFELDLRWPWVLKFKVTSILKCTQWPQQTKGLEIGFRFVSWTYRKLYMADILATSNLTSDDLEYWYSRSRLGWNAENGICRQNAWRYTLGLYYEHIGSHMWRIFWWPQMTLSGETQGHLLADCAAELSSREASCM